MVVFQNNRSKRLTPTPNKPVLSSSASHTSFASNSTQTSISLQLDNKDVTTNLKNNSASNIDIIHSCVTPRKLKYRSQVTSATTYLTPLNGTIPIAIVELHTTKQYPLLVNIICIFRITKNRLMQPSVSNHG